MDTSIDKKAARFGRYGLGIPRNIREGTAKYRELKRRADRRFVQLVKRKLENRDSVRPGVWPEYHKAETDLAEATRSNPTRFDFDTVSLMQKYKKSSIFKRPRIAALLRKRIAEYKKVRRKLRETLEQLTKRHMVLHDLYYAHSILLIADFAHKQGYGVYSDVMPIWYEHVLQREMPASVRKKMLLLRKGYKIKFNPSDFGNDFRFRTYMLGWPLLNRHPFYTKTIANNADPLVPGMLHGAKDIHGIDALLRGDDVWVTPHRDVASKLAENPKRNYMIALNHNVYGIGGYDSHNRPLFTPHKAGDIHDPLIRSAILQGLYYTKDRTVEGASDWRDRADYQAIAYLEPFRHGVDRNWRDRNVFRVFSKSKDSDTGWLLIRPILARDKYEHLRLLGKFPDTDLF